MVLTMKGEPVKYEYHTSVQWTEKKKGVLHAEGKPDITIACPPEFGGHPGIWSPEDLFLASVEVCILTTFLWFVQKYQLPLISYASTAHGTVQLVGGTFQFTTITIHIQLGVSFKEKFGDIDTLIKKVKRACLISNSITTDVHIDVEIAE